MDDKKPHGIFFSDPGSLMGLVNKYVKVALCNKKVLEGIVYTIDPVSESIVLIRKNENATAMEIILKNSIEDVDVCKMPEEQMEVEMKDLFQQRNSFTKKALGKLREDLKAWLLSNMMPVSEVGDALHIENLEVRPPYTPGDCYCNNPIVLARIQELIKAMPS